METIQISSMGAPEAETGADCHEKIDLIVPSDDSEETGVEELSAKLIQRVRDHEFEEVLHELRDIPAKKIQSISWDLLPLILTESDALQERKEKAAPDSEKCNSVIDDIISILGSSITPKARLLMNLESLPSIKTSYGFNSIVENVDESLCQRKPYSTASLDWALEVICDCLGKLPSPQERNYDSAQERKLMDVEPEVNAITSRYDSLLTLLKNQFDHLDKTGGLRVSEKKRLQMCLHLVRPLATTLGLLDLSAAEESKSSSNQHVQSKRLAQFIGYISKNPVSVFELADCRRSKTADDDLIVDSLSAGVLAYMVVYLSQNFPRVYSPDFLADTLLSLSWKLLSSPRALHVLKGLDLAEVAIVYVSSVRKSDRLQLVSLRVLKALFVVMTSCSVEDARKKGMPLWNQLYEKCHPEIQLELLFLLFKSCENPSVRGFILDTWRKQVVKSNHGNGAEIVQKLIFLPEEEQTDLLHHSEYLLASLNMLRYLFKRGILEKLPSLERYLSDFKKAIQLSRAHYELRLKTDGSAERDMLIPNVPKDMQDSVLSHALTRLDLMESLLGMVQSLYDSM